MSLSSVGVVEELSQKTCQDREQAPDTQKLMQKRYDNKNQKKIRPLLPDFAAISAVSAIFPPKRDPPCKGSYNSRRHWIETPGASQALTAAHHLNHVNHSSDITQTLANSRKLS